MENEMSKKEMFWFFYFEFAVCLDLMLVGYLLAKELYIPMIFIMLLTILNFGIYGLYTSHYNIKPFFFKLFPKKVQEKYK